MSNGRADDRQIHAAEGGEGVNTHNISGLAAPMRSTLKGVTEIVSFYILRITKRPRDAATVEPDIPNESICAMSAGHIHEAMHTRADSHRIDSALTSDGIVR